MQVIFSGPATDACVHIWALYESLSAAWKTNIKTDLLVECGIGHEKYDAEHTMK